MSAVDSDRITAVIRDVAAEEILPRWRRLTASEIAVTGGDAAEVVTVVDGRVEARVGRTLAALAPGIPVLGEEATVRRPELRRKMEAQGTYWVLDPIDGTANFAAGKPSFGVMLALIRGGTTVLSWIHLPATGAMYRAELHAGAECDGRRLRRARPTEPIPRGAIYDRFMPPALADATRRALAGKHQATQPSFCAAVDYPALIEGDIDFVINHRLRPWDHAPGALLLSEAGGVVEHADGGRYQPTSPDRRTILAATPALAAQMRFWLAMPTPNQ